MSDWTPRRIRSLRARLGLTQESFAQKLGVSFVSVSRWENNQNPPSPLAEQALSELEKEEGEKAKA